MFQDFMKNILHKGVQYFCFILIFNKRYVKYPIPGKDSGHQGPIGNKTNRSFR